jgi:hypothetical protein
MKLHETSRYLTGLLSWPRFGPEETAYLKRHQLAYQQQRCLRTGLLRNRMLGDARQPVPMTASRGSTAAGELPPVKHAAGKVRRLTGA